MQFRWVIPLFVLLSACVAPKDIPQDLSSLMTPQELGQASRQAYQVAKSGADKKERTKQAHFGIVYAEKCLKKDPKDKVCLYFHVLNTGVFISLYHPNYQRGLKSMVSNCETLITIDPGYENGGCYRILGNIYAKTPSFSLNPKNITQDLDKSVEYFQAAVQVAPDYPLNRLFLAQTLEKVGKQEEAKEQLREFNRLKNTTLDSEYPEWQKERDELARKLHLGNMKF